MVFFPFHSEPRHLTVEYLNLSAKGKEIENSQKKYKWSNHQLSVGILNKYSIIKNFSLYAGCGISLLKIKKENIEEGVKEVNFGVYGEFGIENKLAGNLNWNLVSGYLFSRTDNI